MTEQSEQPDAALDLAVSESLPARRLPLHALDAALALEGEGGSASALAVAPLLAALDSHLSHLHALMRELAQTHSTLTKEAQPAYVAALEREHASAIELQQSAVTERQAVLRTEQQTWNETEAPARRRAILVASTELDNLRDQFEQLHATHVELQEEVDTLQAAEVLQGARSVPPPSSSLVALPLKALHNLLQFLGKEDLAHAASTCFWWSRRLDRGALWARLCIRLVTSIVAGQRATARALEAKRIMLAGLPQDFQSSNFLATIAARQSIAAPSAGSTSESEMARAASPPPPVALSPQQLQSQIQVTLTGAAVAAAATSSSAAAGSKPRPTGSHPPPKSDMFAAALKQLQRAVDPALSDFEDQSLKLSSHQAVLAYLLKQRQESKHRLGLARIEAGAEMDKLRGQSRQKDSLARQIHAIESQIAAEKSKQSLAAAAAQAESKKERTQQNLRRNFESIVQQSLGAEAAAAEEEEAAAASAAAAAAASDPASPAALTPAQEAQQTAASIALLKQQKRVLIKALKSISAELEATRIEKEDYARKLAEIKAKLQAVDL